jgi:hypothetical protein
MDSMNTQQDRHLASAMAEALLVGKPRQLVNVSRAHWCRLEVAGKTPAAIRLGRKKLYRQRDLALWVEWSCPARNEFEARLAQRSGIRSHRAGVGD